MVDALEGLVVDSFDDGQRAQVFLRLADGGLGFGSAEAAVAPAFLGSWALTLQDVAACLDETSWQGFQARCGPVADSIGRAEAKLREVGGGTLEAVDWVACLAEARPKMQGAWSRKLRERGRQKLLETLSVNGKVDLRSAGGQGAGGFLEAPVVREGEAPAVMPEAHFTVELRDRLRLDVCPPGSRCQHRKADGGVCGELLDGQERAPQRRAGLLRGLPHAGDWPHRRHRAARDGLGQGQPADR
jgi:hypothetical protein